MVIGDVISFCISRPAGMLSSRAMIERMLGGASDKLRCPEMRCSEKPAGEIVEADDGGRGAAGAVGALGGASGAAAGAATGGGGAAGATLGGADSERGALVSTGFISSETLAVLGASLLAAFHIHCFL